MESNYTERLSRISIDTGLSISEAEEALIDGLVAFDKRTQRFVITDEQLPTNEEFFDSLIPKPLTKTEEEWLTR